jgi:3-hydroxybutyryl-CoA dehydrogenase
MISRPQTIGVCGLGQIGLPLSLVCWRSGYRVLLFDVDRGKMAVARQQLQKMDEWLRSQLPQLEPDYGEILPAENLAVLNREADLVFECVSEELDAKVALFRSLAGAAERGAVLCSCTSGLSISKMGALAGCSRQLAGTHFWNPPHLMPLVEVVKGAETAEEAVQVVISVSTAMGKRAVRVNIDAPGFIGNRMLHAMWREAIHIVEQGIASPEDVDTVAKLTFGLRQVALGPLEHMDLAGLDLIHRIHDYLLSDLAANQHPGWLLRDLVDKGRLGMKSGRGFYDWTQRDPRALVEARDQQIIRELKRLTPGTKAEGAQRD